MFSGVVSSKILYVGLYGRGKSCSLNSPFHLPVICVNCSEESEESVGMLSPMEVTALRLLLAVLSGTDILSWFNVGIRSIQAKNALRHKIEFTRQPVNSAQWPSAGEGGTFGRKSRVKSVSLSVRPVRSYTSSGQVLNPVQL